MRRRDYLAVTGTVAATVTDGLSSMPEEVTAQDGQTEQDEPIAQTEDFELVEVDTPNQVEVMTPYTYSYTVANTGDEDADFWSDFTVDAWGDTGVVESRHAISIPAGEEVAVENNTAYSPYVGTITYRLRAFEESFSVEAVPAYREIGEQWRSPEDIVITIENLEFADAYEYVDYDGSTAEDRAPEGSQWAFVWINVENVSSESVYLPFADDLTIITESKQFNSTYISKEERAYESDEVETGIVREGWIAYEVPAELSPEDVVVNYTDDVYEGEWTARWAVTVSDEE